MPLRNLKKVYPHIRQQPRNITVDSRTYNQNQYQVIYPVYYITAITGSNYYSDGAITYGYGQFEEGFVNFNNEISVTKIFDLSFTGEPIVVLENMATDSLSNVNVLIESSSITSTKISLSDIFSGTIRYMAFYSPTYPAYFLSNSTTIRVSATSSIVPIGSSSYNLAFNALSTIPSYAYITNYDYLSNGEANISSTSSSLATTGSYIELSTPSAIKINFVGIE